MLTRASLLALLLVASPVAAQNAREWIQTDTVWEVSYQVLLALDYGTTRWALTERHSWGWSEANPILGRNPTQAELLTYNLGISVLHLGVSYLLPAPYRRWWQVITVGVQAYPTLANLSVGCRLAF